jgi:hypothetical protein
LFKNPVVSGLVSLGVVAWCAYDLWFSSDPGTTGTRILNYFLMVMALAGVVGAFILATKKKA